MSLDSMIARTRERQAQMFRSTCRITRASGPRTFDEGTFDTTQPTTTVYEGVCNIRPEALQGIDVEAGERESRLLRPQAKLPHDTDVQKDDTLTVLTSRFDAMLVGLSFRVTDVPPNDWQVARIAQLELLT